MPRHRCDESTIDYRSVNDGHVWCRVCGRTWSLSPTTGWSMSPQEPAPPR